MRMNYFYKGKTIIITGASYGIGRSMAIQYSNFDCNIVLASRSIVELEKVALQVRKNGSNCLVVQCDVTNKDELVLLVNETVKNYKTIDLLINNVGVTSRFLIKNATTQVLRDLMEVNFWGAVELTLLCLPHIKESKGCIVSISSVIGKVPVPGRSGYSASKHALEGFFETLRMENLDTDIDVIVIRPSYTKTNTRINAMTESGQAQNYSTLDEDKLLSPEEASRQIIHAIYRKKHGFTLGKKMEGRWLITLYALLPKLVSRLIVKKIKVEKHSLFK